MTSHTTMSKVSRIEVISTFDRRSTSVDLWRRSGGSSPRAVAGGGGLATARRHGLSGGQLFTWRRLAREGRLSGRSGTFEQLRLICMKPREQAVEGDEAGFAGEDA